MKNKSENKKFLLILSRLLCIVILILNASIFIGCDGSNSIKASKQSDYRILPDTDLLVSSFKFPSLEMLAQESDLVLVGQTSKY